jgi:uncharacterized protein (TIGR02118 family)
VITIVFLLRRRPDVGEAEFHRYWRDEHGPLVASHKEALGITHYVQLHSLEPAVSEALRLSRDCAPERYDGVALVSFESLEALGASAASDAGRAAGAALLEDERRFLDLPNCVIWLADEHVVVR